MVDNLPTAGMEGPDIFSPLVLSVKLITANGVWLALQVVVSYTVLSV